MKKFLLLAALCFSLMQTQNVFAKCNPSLTYSYASESYATIFTIPSTAVDTLYLLLGDSIEPKFNSGSVVCSNCNDPSEGWYRDGNLIAPEDSAGFKIVAGGFYEFIKCVYHVNQVVYHWQFLVIMSPTGINAIPSSTHQFPFSQLSSINNLRYKIINPLGQIIEQGKFTGEIILRTQNPSRHLMPGIYFVIYSDADDNRQVLTDKVMVSNE